MLSVQEIHAAILKLVANKGLDSIGDGSNLGTRLFHGDEGVSYLQFDGWSINNNHVLTDVGGREFVFKIIDLEHIVIVSGKIREEINLREGVNDHDDKIKCPK
jgi:hypothetical protein